MPAPHDLDQPQDGSTIVQFRDADVNKWGMDMNLSGVLMMILADALPNSTVAAAHNGAAFGIRITDADVEAYKASHDA